MSRDKGNHHRKTSSSEQEVNTGLLEGGQGMKHASPSYPDPGQYGRVGNSRENNRSRMPSQDGPRALYASSDWIMAENSNVHASSQSPRSPLVQPYQGNREPRKYNIGSRKGSLDTSDSPPQSRPQKPASDARGYEFSEGNRKASLDANDMVPHSRHNLSQVQAPAISSRQQSLNNIGPRQKSPQPIMRNHAPRDKDDEEKRFHEGRKLSNASQNDFSKQKF